MNGTLAKYIDKQPLGAYGNFSPRCNENPKATGISIHEYTATLRRELASTLRHDPALTREAIAARCGFRSARQLQRLWETPVREFSPPIPML